MKIRNGFVSNSSSSSYIIVGKKINIDDVDAKTFKNKDYRYMFKSSDNNDGETWGHINDSKMLNVLKNNPDVVKGLC